MWSWNVGETPTASLENPYQRREKRRVQMRNPLTLTQKVLFTGALHLSFNNTPLNETVPVSRDARNSHYKSQLLSINKLLLYFFLVPHLGQTVKGKKYWITRLIFWQGQKFSRILISPIHLPLQSSNNNERKIQPTHIKNILTWCLNHHLHPAELVSVVSEETNFWTAPHLSDITGGAWLDR